MLQHTIGHWTQLHGMVTQGKTYKNNQNIDTDIQINKQRKRDGQTNRFRFSDSSKTKINTTHNSELANKNAPMVAPAVDSFKMVGEPFPAGMNWSPPVTMVTIFD